MPNATRGPGSTVPCCANCGKELRDPAERRTSHLRWFCSEECQSHQRLATGEKLRGNRPIGRLVGVFAIVVLAAIFAVAVIRSVSTGPVPLGRWATFGDWTLRVASVRGTARTDQGLPGRRLAVVIQARYRLRRRAGGGLVLLAEGTHGVHYLPIDCGRSGDAPVSNELLPSEFARATRQITVCFDVEANDVHTVRLWVPRNGTTYWPFAL